MSTDGLPAGASPTNPKIISDIGGNALIKVCRFWNSRMISSTLGKTPPHVSEYEYARRIIVQEVNVGEYYRLNTEFWNLYQRTEKDPMAKVAQTTFRKVDEMIDELRVLKRFVNTKQKQYIKA